MESALNSEQSYEETFSIFMSFNLFFHFFSIFGNNFFVFFLPHQKNKTKIGNISLYNFVRNSMRIQKTVLVFLLALIVLTSLLLKVQKHILWERHLYIYIYIYICIYWALLWLFEAINASYQGIICSCMIFQPSCFILYCILLL